MIYAYDLWAQMPVRDLYDSQMMAIAINAAKDVYNRGQQDLKDFRKEYGTFLSPFAKDMDAYGKMMGNVTNIINEAYKNGIDLFKSPQGRSLVLLAINSVDPATINAMRANAKTGYAYLDAMQKLIANGKYDPDMAEAFLKSQGLPSFNDFSTAENKTWGLSSPIEAVSLRDLTSPGFAHRTAHELTRELAMKAMGASYDPRAKYTGWVYDDLYNTAGTLVPGLRGDWRGEYFRNQSAKKVLAQNPNATQADIDRQFQADIAEANRQWIIDPKGDLGDYYNRVKIGLQAEGNRLARDKFNWEKQKDAAELELKRQKQAADLGGENTELQGFSLAQRWYDTAMANAWSVDGVKKDWWDMANSYGTFGRNVDKLFYDFGLKYATKFNENDLLNYLRLSGVSDASIKSAELILPIPKLERTKHQQSVIDALSNKYKIDLQLNSYKSAIKGYENKFSFEMDTKSVAEAIGPHVSGNDRVVQATEASIDKLYGVSDIISGTAGFTKRYDNTSTDKLRKKIETYGVDNVTITPLGKGYGSLRKNDASFEVMPKVRVSFKDANGKVVEKMDAYYDIGLKSEKTKGGAYVGNYLQTGGYRQVGTPGLYSSMGNIYNNNVSFIPGIELSLREFNMNPDYNNWTQYGGWDTRVSSSQYKASPTQKLGTY